MLRIIKFRRMLRFFELSFLGGLSMICSLKMMMMKMRTKKKVFNMNYSKFLVTNIVFRLTTFNLSSEYSFLDLKPPFNKIKQIILSKQDFSSATTATTTTTKPTAFDV